MEIEERKEQWRHTETLPDLYKRFLAKSKDMTGAAYSQDGSWRDGQPLGFVSHPLRVCCTTTPDFPLRYFEVSLSFPFLPEVRETRGVTGGEMSVIIACQRCHPKICPSAWTGTRLPFPLKAIFFRLTAKPQPSSPSPPPPPLRPPPRRPTQWHTWLQPKNGMQGL